MPFNYQHGFGVLNIVKSNINWGFVRYEDLISKGLLTISK